MYLYLIICLRSTGVSRNVDGEQVDILYLAPHRQQEQHTEIHDQDRPVDGDIKHLRGGAKEGDDDGARPAEPRSNFECLGDTAKRADGVPKLPLRQSPHKRPKFVVPLGGKRWAVVGGAFFDLVGEEVFLERRVELGL